MKNIYKITLFVLFLFVVFQSTAENRDTVYTTYKDKTFTTKCVVSVNASKEVMNNVIDDYMYQVKYDLDKLYEWALKGLKLRKESDDLLIFNFKSTKYNERTDLIRATGDVEVPRVINFPDIHVDSKWTKTVVSDRTNVLIDVKYSDAFLKKTTGHLYMMPNGKQCVLTLQTNVEFGWFFNVFITRSMFRNIMEWRFEKLLNNVKIEAEKRQKLR